jgi:hypothetical protein
MAQCPMPMNIRDIVTLAPVIPELSERNSSFTVLKPLKGESL